MGARFFPGPNQPFFHSVPTGLAFNCSNSPKWHRDSSRIFCDRLNTTPSLEIFTSSSQILEYITVRVNADFAMVIKLRILREVFLVYPSVLGNVMTKPERRWERCEWKQRPEMVAERCCTAGSEVRGRDQSRGMQVASRSGKDKETDLIFGHPHPGDQISPLIFVAISLVC